MDQELKNRLDAIETKLTDVHVMVTKVRRVQRNAMITRISYWTFIILLGVGALWFIKPFLNQIGEAYGIDVTNMTGF